nr:ran binding protein 9 [Hymenolepis microstoma]
MANSTQMTQLQELYRSVYTSEPTQSLPSSWRRKEYQSAFKLAPSGLAVTRVAQAATPFIVLGRSADEQNDSLEASPAFPIIKSDHPVPFNTGVYYYETEICALKSECVIVIGFSTKNTPKSIVWDSSCYGLDNSGALYHSSPDIVLCPNGFKENDIIGCGVNFITNSLFFTKNGQFLGNAFEGVVPIYGNSEVHPVILMSGLQSKILTNFGEEPFVYPFFKHISSERFSQESQLVSALSRDFIDVKMRDLVAGYLVHHGYIETASSFSRWTKMGESASSPKKTRCDTDLATASTAGEGAATAELSTESSTQSGVEPESFPGIGSMQHRRSLRSFCQRCKFGLVASTLNALYPRIVDKYPELILQLRCRQLIEMVHRHSVRLSGQGPTSSSSDSKLLLHQRQQNQQQMEEEGGCGRGSRKRPCVADTTSSEGACCVCTSGSVPTLATYDDGHAQSLVPQSHELCSSAATSCDAMDIDSSSLVPESTSEQASLHISHLQQQQLVSKSHQVANGGEALSSTKMTTCSFPDDEDDDGTNDPVIPIGGAAPQQQQVPAVAGSSASLNALSSDDSDRDYLMRQIHFSRSLMDLVKDVERKKGTISPETDRLLHDSVCLLAYEKPADPECPLRCLLDSAGRDNIASLINSAILTEEHKLPAQPIIEKILFKLERYITSSEGSPVQSLAHFLLYHLTPSQYHEEMNRLVKLNTESRSLSDPPINNNSNNSSSGSTKADESLQSIEHPRGTARRNRRLNHAAVSNGNSNGRVSPPKRRSNGARRIYWRRQVPVGSTEVDDENEDEVEEFSLEDEGGGVQLHRHEELEDDIEMNIEGGDVEDGVSLEDEEEVELMTASMEEDGFEDSEDGDEQEEEDEMPINPALMELEDLIPFSGWHRVSSDRNQVEVGGSSRGDGHASTSRQGSEDASTEPFLSYVSRSPRYAIVESSSATDNLWSLLYPPNNSRRGQQPPPSYSTSDDATNNANQ